MDNPYCSCKLTQCGQGARDPDARGPGGKTPLHRAVDNDRYDTTEMLLLHNASVNAVDKYYWTPLHKAAEKGWYWVTKLLLAHGAEVRTAPGGARFPRRCRGQ